MPFAKIVTSISPITTARQAQEIEDCSKTRAAFLRSRLPHPRLAERDQFFAITLSSTIGVLNNSLGLATHAPMSAAFFKQEHVWDLGGENSLHPTCIKRMRLAQIKLECTQQVDANLQDREEEKERNILFTFPSLVSGWLGGSSQFAQASSKTFVVGEFVEKILPWVSLVPRISYLADDFLREHSFLSKLLLEAYQTIKKYFGQGVELALEVYADPEDGNRELLLLIRTDKPAAEALPILDRFDEEWWIDNFDRAEGLLTIKLEYV